MPGTRDMRRQRQPRANTGPRDFASRIRNTTSPSRREVEKMKCRRYFSRNIEVLPSEKTHTDRCCSSRATGSNISPILGCSNPACTELSATSATVNESLTLHDLTPNKNSGVRCLSPLKSEVLEYHTTRPVKHTVFRDSSIKPETLSRRRKTWINGKDRVSVEHENVTSVSPRQRMTYNEDGAMSPCNTPDPSLQPRDTLDTSRGVADASPDDKPQTSSRQDPPCQVQHNDAIDQQRTTETIPHSDDPGYLSEGEQVHQASVGPVGRRTPRKSDASCMFIDPPKDLIDERPQPRNPRVESAAPRMQSLEVTTTPQDSVIKSVVKPRKAMNALSRLRDLLIMAAPDSIRPYRPTSTASV